MKIKKIHDRKTGDKTAEDTQGNEVVITEYQTQKLWDKWVMSKGADKDETGPYCIFIFETPVEF